MSATSSALPADLFHYSEINTEHRARLAARLAELDRALDRARWSCSQTHWPLWELPGHFDSSLGVTLTLDDAIAAVQAIADLDAWIAMIAQGFLDADSASRHGLNVADRAVIDALAPSDRRFVAEAIAPPPAVVASNLIEVLDDVVDIDDGEIDDIARAGLERWASYRSTPPARDGYDPLESAWETLGDAFEDKGFSYRDAIEIMDRLEAAEAALLAHGDDAAYNAALIGSLGSERLVDLADVAAQVVWLAQSTGDGPLAKRARDFAELLSISLASATHHLDRSFLDGFVASLWDGGTFDDAALGLFLQGELSSHAAVLIGQLGIDILVGETRDGDSLTINKGEGSSWLEGFDEFGTPWRARGAVLIEAAARSPHGAALIMADSDNVKMLVDEDLARRDNRASPDSGAEHDVTGPAVAALIEAATIVHAERDPGAARAVAIDVIAAVLAEDYDRLTFSDQNPAFGQALAAIAALYLPEFFINTEPNPDAPSLGDSLADGEFIWMGETQTAEFLQIAARSSEGASVLIDSAQLTVTGLLAAALRTAEPVLVSRAAAIAAAVEIAVSDSMCEVGEATDAHNRRNNDRLDDVVRVSDALLIAAQGGASAVAMPITKVLRSLLFERSNTDNRERAITDGRSLAQRMRELRDTDVAVAYLDYLRRVADDSTGPAVTDEMRAQVDRMVTLTERYLGEEASRRWWESGELPDTPDDVGSLITAVRAEDVPNAILERFVAALGDLDPLRSCG